MSMVEKCASAARATALSGADVVKIIEGIISCLGETVTPFTFIAVLREAFEIPVQTLRGVENWDRLHPQGDMATPEVVSTIGPWITRFSEAYSKFSLKKYSLTAA